MKLSAANLWTRLQSLSGKTLYTLDRKKPFDIVTVNTDRLVVSPHASSKERPIHRQVFTGAWQELTQRGEISFMDIKVRHSDWSPTYVAVILAELPGVTYKVRPLVLYMKE